MLRISWKNFALIKRNGCLQVKYPQRDLPLGIGLSVFICASLYMLVAGVVVGLVPYNLMDPDTPMSNAFADNGMPWAM